MSTEEKYVVLFRNLRDREALTDPESRDAAHATARRLEAEGYSVGSAMTEDAARDYMRNRYGTTYRGVTVPADLRADGTPRSVFEAWKRGVDAELDRAKAPEPDENPFAPDLTMSPEVADYVLRAVTGLLEDGYWPKAYTGYGPGDKDEQDYDVALIRKAADTVGRDRIKNSELQRALAELDSDAGEAT